MLINYIKTLRNPKTQEIVNIIADTEMCARDCFK